MIIKVELYYEVTKKAPGPLPKDIRESVSKMVLERVPEHIDGFTDKNTPREMVVELQRISGETMEKIRTGR